MSPCEDNQHPECGRKKQHARSWMHLAALTQARHRLIFLPHLLLHEHHLHIMMAREARALSASA